MTQRIAKEKGYTFTGHYSQDKEEMKRIAKEIRKSGKYAMVITKTYKGRISSTIGYSVYEKEKE